MYKIDIVETGAIKKDWGGRLPIAIVYPNTYYVGMSNLAVHQLYRLLNADPKIAAERIFLPEKGEARSVESNRAISEFHALAFSFSFETDYLNIPNILGKNIPLLKKERDASHPVLIAGGPAVTLNPSALSEVFNCIVAGEAEPVMDEMIEMIRERSCKKIIQSYPQGSDPAPAHSVIWTNDTEFGHMHLVEVSRGCPWGCKFCATPPIYGSYRTRGKESIFESIEFGLPHRRHIGLIGADVLAHPNFKEIANSLIERGIKVSLSSLRTNRIDADVADILAMSGHRRTTLGIEAGTETLRKKIDKGLTDKNIFAAVKNLAHAGITNLKLYFMIGLPGEADEDIAGIAALTSEIRGLILKERSPRTLASDISAVVTPFVPKRLTPFANEPFAGEKYLKETLKRLSRLFGKIPNTRLSGESPAASAMEYRLSHASGEEISALLTERAKEDIS